MTTADNRMTPSRAWSISMQVLVWTTVTVDAADLEQAMDLAEELARDVYGDDVFINRDSTEVT